MKNVYKIKIDGNTTYYIDLPLEVGRDTGLYRASLGHKVNHSFTPNCRCCRLQVYPGADNDRPLSQISTDAAPALGGNCGDLHHEAGGGE